MQRTPTTAPPPASLCLLRTSALGDVTHVVPLVRTLQARWPETRLTWLIGRLEHKLVGDLDGVEFIVFDKREGRAAYRAVREQLDGRRFDALLHMQVALAREPAQPRGERAAAHRLRPRALEGSARLLRQLPHSGAHAASTCSTRWRASSSRWA